MELKDINELIEFDHKTMQAVIDIHELKDKTIKEITEEKEKIHKNTWAEIYAKVEETKKELDSKIAKDAKNSEDEYNKLAAAIKETFQNKKSEWEKELFNRSIK